MSSARRIIREVMTSNSPQFQVIHTRRNLWRRKPVANDQPDSQAAILV
jgi:hypothetical protein